MTLSMTAFARQQAELEWGTLIWEIRSVNHRYLEPNFRLHENFRELEGFLREKLRKSLSRGKVECTLRFTPSVQADAQLTVNMPLAAEVKSALDQVNGLLEDPGKINPVDILRWPGVIAEKQTDMKAVMAAAKSLFESTLNELLEGRQREGQELAKLIQQRLDSINAIVSEVRTKMPEILQGQRRSLEDRVAALNVELESGRLEQEIVLLAQKADVDEELDRLDTHVTEVARVLNEKGAIGRRLDFLMQELNREANTLSSKSVVADTTQSAVELKVLIEQMREQIQNIE